MTNLNIKNVSASVKARLSNIARNTKRPFPELLQYYGMERFLFRLSISSYKNIFILKGALLLKVWKIADSRATRDIDALARTSNSLDNIIKIIKEICEITTPIDDGVDFIVSSIRGEMMQLQKEYEGIRVKFEGCLGLAKIPMQVDIGFGDVITPCAKELWYPNLLDFPKPKIKMYPQETLISEKILTMIEKGDINSRIKDYYDVWLLFRKNQFSYDVLKLALERTAEARKIKYDFEIIRTAIDRYSKNPETKMHWARFKQNKTPEAHKDLSFDVIISDIINVLKKIEKDSDEILSSILQRMIQGKLKGKLLYDAFEKVLSHEKDINRQNINGHGILQLLIRKARLDKRKKLEIIKKVVDCGAQVDVSDKSGLTPFQVAVKNRDKATADYFLSIGARDKVPIKNSDYYHLYLRMPKL